MAEKDIARFMSKVRKDDGGCWLWTGPYTHNGYGLFGHLSRMKRAHRVSYQLHVGPIPKGDGYHGTCVLHRCDVRSCVNPAHLFLGTQKENVADMFAKGRGRTPCLAGAGHWTQHRPERVARGERHGRAKVSDADRAEIVRAYAAGGVTLTALGQRYGVTRWTVSEMASRARIVTVAAHGTVVP